MASCSSLSRAVHQQLRFQAHLFQPFFPISLQPQSIVPRVLPYIANKQCIPLSKRFSLDAIGWADQNEALGTNQTTGRIAWRTFRFYVRNR
jgi:hypothetical protein